MAEFKGLTVPVEKGRGGLFATQGIIALIRSSLHLILHTRIGTRPMLREFGSRLPELVFEQNDDILRGLAKTYVVDAIRRWERRVDIVDVQVTAEEHTFSVNLRYLIRTNGQEDLLVLDFARAA